LAVRWRSHTSSPKLAVVMVRSFFAAVETAERERNGERERGVRCQLGLHICACARDVEASAERERHAVARL
jgi:hypothetical protein